MLFSLLLTTLCLSQALAQYKPSSTPVITPRPSPTPLQPQGRAVGYGPNVANNEASAIEAQKSSSEVRASSALSALDAQKTAGISIGKPNDTLPDPCGPPNQPPGKANSASTCHANVSTADITSSEYYGVQCLTDDTGELIDMMSCSDSADTVCEQISGLWGSDYQTTDKWIWSTEGGNCTFGYWLPEGGAPPPSKARCLNMIYGPMISACGEGLYNVGSVNLRERPSASANAITSNGTAVDPGWPSYIMVAQSSAWGVNSEDATYISR